ncbi:TonB family protein [Acinetobacter radioresistens]|uniref:TonB family protein n=1 Tax=Acinetobacter radioresistens TaxID=40216 RepID=UPI00254D9D0A|nr:TonB family protein [Acinetobacter radioresistens]MDK8754510.1 TonB family protein [Acinetobacter radioresistens]
MSHSSVSSMPPSNPMKKKIVAALAVVMVGHIGVLWGVSHLKTADLKPIEKEPLQVRFVKIQQPPEPLPPKPKVEPKKAEPAKPKEVKEVKVVEKLLPPPPKKVEKVQQVKKAEAPKPVAKPVETPPAPSPVATTTVSETKIAKPAPAPAAPPAPPSPLSPKTVSIGGAGVQWSRSPKPSYSNKDLQGEPRVIVVHIEADEKGSIIKERTRITKSSGISALDEKILRAVRSAKFKPYKENGVAYPIRVEQPFELTLNPNG